MGSFFKISHQTGCFSSLKGKRMGRKVIDVNVKLNLTDTLTLFLSSGKGSRFSVLVSKPLIALGKFLGAVRTGIIVQIMQIK